MGWEGTVSEDTAGAGFAGLLRELKDRSGHSYGTLAKRLHMSTSTLHRYCRGDVVPTDYAPVERLARLCKASPEELLELHRRWVLADTNRPRKGGAEPGGTAAAVAPAAAAPSPEHTDPGPARESGAAAPMPVEPLPADAPDRPSAEPAPKARRRNRRAVIAGIAVAAVAGAVALAVNLPARHAEVRNGPVGAASVPKGEEGRRTDGKQASAAPSGSSPAPSAPASPGPGTAEPGAGAVTDAASPPPAAAREDTAAGTPVKVTAQPHTWESPCGQHYLIDKPPAQVAPPPLEQDAPAWVAASGAVPAGEQYVTLTLQGSGKDTVVLDSLTVRMAGKRAPLAWNDYAMGYPGVGCGAAVPTRSFTVALDAARPAVVPESGQPDFPFKVSESEPEVFYVKADASAYDVSWYLELAWSSGSRHGTLKIDNSGRPFRTSGHNGRPGYEFPLGGDAWAKAGTTS